MVVLTIYSIVIVEILIISFLSKRLEFYNPILFLLCIPFFYTHSLFLDHLFFGLNEISYPQYFSNSLAFDSVNHLKIIGLNFSYLLGIFLVTIMRSRYLSLSRVTGLQTTYLDFQNKELRPNVLFIATLSMLALMFVASQLIGLERSEVRALFNSPLKTILIQAIFIFLCFCFISSKSKNLPNLFIACVLIIFCILSAQRENIILFIFAMLLRLPPRKMAITNLISLVIILYVGLYYKTFITALSLVINGNFEDLTTALVVFESFEVAFSFSSIDPAISLLLLNDYLSDVNIYNAYWGSYFINTIMQLIRTFFDVSWPSLGETATSFYTSGRMGTAFSFILEAMLNFWIFGPLVLGLFIANIFFIADAKLKRFDYRLYYFIFFLFILKLVRTELAIVLKLYILPALIAYIIFNLLNRRYKGYNN